MDAKTRFFSSELLRLGYKKSRHQHLDTREKAVYCFCHLDDLEDAPNYLHKLIVEAVGRIYQRRADLDRVRFGYNETILINRLYEILR